ncbi:MAG TPA: Uma2 family endonuclease [Pyrinomonadaceae bacterium]|nr:Uma2 family endonuclease [Pyrinomonadaceae bacterium]
MSTTSTALMTAEELSQLPDSPFRHELINGELITMPLPGTPHGRITLQLAVPLSHFVWDHELGQVYDHSGFQLTVNPDTVLGPDIAFISKQRLKEMGEVEPYWQGPPDLAVEVLSPGDRPGKVNKKISRWLEFGTKQVWIVDRKHRKVTVYRSESDTTTFSGSDSLEAEDLFPGFRLSLDRIFGPMPGIEIESKYLELEDAVRKSESSLEK